MNDPNDTALAEQPVSLEESLSAAYDDAAPTSETTNDVVNDTPHHFGGEQQQAQPQAVEAPQHWSQQDREFFTRQTPEAQQWLLQRHRSMEGDYTRKQQEAAEWRRQNEAHIQYAEQARPIWDSLAQRYARQGITPVQIQQMSAAWVQRLNEDPKAALVRELDEELGVRAEIGDIVEVTFHTYAEAARTASGRGGGEPCAWRSSART